MNEIKVNNPLKIKIFKAHDQYSYFTYKGKKFYGEEYVDEDTGELTFVVAKADNRNYHLLDVGSVGKKGDYTIRGQAAREFKENEYVKIDELNEITRLQHLAGIQEIKVSNPIISSEQIIDLYNKIDSHLDSIWTFDDDGYNDNPIASDIDEKLMSIVREVDPSFMSNMKIEYSIPKDPVKKQLLYQKLKQLDSKLNYNNP